MNYQEQFEKWISTRKLCEKYGAKLHKNSNGTYKDLRVNGHWITWQAAISFIENSK